MHSEVIDQRLLKCQHPRLRQALQFRSPSKAQAEPECSLSQAILMLEVSREPSPTSHRRELGTGWNLVKKVLQGLVASWQFITCPL